MTFPKLFAASLLWLLALTTESTLMHAADKKITEPGPADKDAPTEFTTTKSGLKYRILRESTGEKPLAVDKVKVHYKGWLDNAKPDDTFDSSYKRNQPAEFPLKGVIRGWTEGMQLIGKGGMIELEIPYDLAYGEAGRPGSIPPKATLHFIIELLSITPGPKPAVPGAVDPDAAEEFTTTKSGLKYRIRRKSDGKKPTASSTVKVHYKGWLDNGNEFDSSYARNDPAEFPLNRVIAAWTEGMQLVGTGGMIELEVPYQLGYGVAGSPPDIPGKATLHFLVEVLAVK